MLYQRFTKDGTITDPRGIPKPQFALKSTINWMNALKTIIEAENSNYYTSYYQDLSIQKGQLTSQQENSIFEQLLFALHQLSAIKTISKTENKADIARVGIINWYYAIYFSSKAMVIAKDGSFQDNHAQTANCWDKQISAHKFIPKPFQYRISNIKSTTIKSEIDHYRGSNSHNNLLIKATTTDEAIGQCLSYLKGTAEWYQREEEEKIRKKDNDFKKLETNDFKTKKAQEIRDGKFSKICISFSHQASRYRGKANYRDVLSLSYKENTEALLNDYVNDIEKVLQTYLNAAGIFCSYKLGRELYAEFIKDVEEKRSFSLSPYEVWPSNALR